MSPNDLVQKVLAEIHEMQDWIPLAGALGAVGINANKVQHKDVLLLVEHLFDDSRVHMGTIEPDTSRTYLTPLPSSMSARDLVEDIFADDAPSSKMMEYFVAENPA